MTSGPEGNRLFVLGSRETAAQSEHRPPEHVSVARFRLWPRRAEPRIVARRIAAIRTRCPEHLGRHRCRRRRHFHHPGRKSSSESLKARQAPPVFVSSTISPSFPSSVVLATSLKEFPRKAMFRRFRERRVGRSGRRDRATLQPSRPPLMLNEAAGRCEVNPGRVESSYKRRAHDMAIPMTGAG